MAGSPVRVPRMGQTAADVTVVRWLVAPGAAIRAGEAVVVVETDKTEVDVESPAAGVLGPHLVAPGDSCEVGAVLAEVLAPDAPAPARAGGADRPYASPKARRLAAARGVELAGLTGTGPGGLVVAGDVAGAGPAAPPSPPAAVVRGLVVRERRARTATQRASARRTAEAWQAPHFVQMVDVDLVRLDALRRRWRAGGGPLAGVGWTALFVAAFARGLAAHPALNAAVDGDDLVLYEAVNIGVAVDSDRGLLVPVVADAHRRSLQDVAVAVRRAATSHEGDPVPGTATLSNLGGYGIRAGTPVLNPPEAVLLFTGAVEERPAVAGGELTVRTMATLSFAFDHRVTDGAAAARFVGTVRAMLEAPERHL